MSAVHPAVRAYFSTTGSVLPPLAVSAAAAVFNRVGPPAPVLDREAPVHASARRGVLNVHGERAVTYSWGTLGAPAVLLVHGWRSRASRFAPLVGDLLGAGLRVVSFDNLAHGDSTGRRTTILDQLSIIRVLAEEEGRPFAGVVGHSFGALAGGLAVHEGVPTERYVGLAPVRGWDSIIDGFAGQTGLPYRLRDAFSRRVATRTFPHEPDPAARFDLARNPVPAGVPTLFVHDTRDSQVPFEDGARLHAAHPGSHLHVTTGLGHNRVVGDRSVRSVVLEHLGRTGLAAAS